MNEQPNKSYFHVQFHLTNRCNLNCKHCYEVKKGRSEEWELDDVISTLKQFEYAFEKWQLNGEISLVGGEPTLYPHLIEVINYIFQSNYFNRLAILTNGVDIPHNVMDVIVEKKPAVQISIDGVDEIKHDFIRGKGTYKKALNTISYLVSQGVIVFVHYVISKYSVPIPWSFIDQMDKMGVRQITFSRDVPIGNSNCSFLLDRASLKEVYDSIFDYSKRLKEGSMKININRPLWANYGIDGRCPVGYQTLTILQNGVVYPCRRLPIEIGNIKRDSIFKIWYESDVLWRLRDRKNIKGCGKCNLLEKCGGARCIAYAITKDFMEADPQCWLL